MKRGFNNLWFIALSVASVWTHTSAQNLLNTDPCDSSRVEFASVQVRWFETDFLFDPGVALTDKGPRLNYNYVSYVEDGKIVVDRFHDLGCTIFSGSENVVAYANQVLDSVIATVTDDSGKVVRKIRMRCGKELGQEENFTLGLLQLAPDYPEYRVENQERYTVWVRMKLRGQAAPRDFSFKFRRYKLRLLVDLQGKDPSEIWGAIVESAAKLQIKIANVLSENDVTNPLIVGYVQVFHYDRRHTSMEK